MDRQVVLDNFVTATRGLGQTVSNYGDCLYFPDNHPGCAIGCQPGFREKFKDSVTEGVDIGSLLTDNAEVRNFFQVSDVEDEDWDFLDTLQTLHDTDEDWYRKNLKKGPLRKFCQKWKLTVPS